MHKIEAYSQKNNNKLVHNIHTKKKRGKGRREKSERY